MRLNLWRAAIAALWLCALLPAKSNAAEDNPATIEAIVAHAVRPVMARYHVPGMAVGVVLDGQSHVFYYGIASKSTRTPVTDATLFEIGSVSKTFTATLTAYAQLRGNLSLSDPASRYLPSLRGSSFDNVSLLQLGTHTSGGLPLQVPHAITNSGQLMAYFRGWTPTHQPGTYRLYSNTSIGMLGMIAAVSMNGDFDAIMRSMLLPGLGLHHTYLDVPKAELDHYAQGYTRTDTPIRMTQGPLAAETYGIRSTADDMLRFVAANMGLLQLDPTLQKAINDTHTGYYRIDSMTQDLVWEQYRYPVTLETLLAGNSDQMLMHANPAVRIDPPLPAADDVLINKTGSTNGFATYVAFVPERRLGIVLLANKNYPIAARVTAAYDVLRQLATGSTRP